MSKSHVLFAAAILLGSISAATADNLPLTDETRLSPLQFIIHSTPGQATSAAAALTAVRPVPTANERVYQVPMAADVLWMQRPTTMNGANN